MTTTPKRGSPDCRLVETLGGSIGLWSELVGAMAADYSPVESVWKPTKLEFGAVCLIKRKERTLAYLIPAAGVFEVSIVLGNRAAALALESDLRAATKNLVASARIYAEGRGVRFHIRSSDDVAAALRLVHFKMTPA
jgi:hypothetical protein